MAKLEKGIGSELQARSQEYVENGGEILFHWIGLVMVGMGR